MRQGLTKLPRRNGGASAARHQRATLGAPFVAAAPPTGLRSSSESPKPPKKQKKAHELTCIIKKYGNEKKERCTPHFGI